MTERAGLDRLRDDVVAAAKAHVAELENPAPDVVMRVSTRGDLQNAVKLLEIEEAKHG